MPKLGGGYTLRSAIPSDAAAVAQLVDLAYEPYIERIGTIPGPMREDYREAIRTRRVIVAERAATIAGVLVLRTTDEGFLIDNVAVHPVHRGVGVGRMLLRHAETEARRAGYDSIYLYTHEKMTENQALYARIGYTEFDRRSDGETTLVYMRKPLGPD
jgi:ribosomal protein S18 acetylase RimI-like enzyme